MSASARCADASRAEPSLCGRARARAKNEIHAVLMRCLKDRPPASDLFGVKGRAWLAEQQLALTERETVDSAVRQVAFLDSEIAAVERLIAAEALSWPEVKRLMTVPGVNVIVAATFMATVGDIRRFPDRRKLTGYLGLDPRVRQSGAGPANHGHISKQGSGSARHALGRGVLVNGPPARPDRGLLSAFARAAVTRSRSSPQRASSRVCSGVC
jgi:transposase